jgi:hypothetical protein
MRSAGQRWKEEQMSWHAGGTEIVNSIREMRPGDWDASEGEVVDRILVLRPATRTRRCCGRDLELVVEAERGTLTWGLWPVALQPLRARVLGQAEAAADVGGRPGTSLHRALLRLLR